MQKSILVAILIVSLFPMSTSFSQTSDTNPTLGISLTSFTPYHYKADDGRTVIIGEVENTKNFPITAVKIWAGFFDDVNLSPLESTVGSTLLEVIPPKGKSPYIIYSPSSNSAITNVSVNLLGFNSAGAKITQLAIADGSLQISDKISYSSTITNNGGIPAEDTRVHLMMYDAFEPPRLIRISTVELSQPIAAGAAVEFSFEEERIPQAVGFTVLAESGNSLSNVIDVEITPPELIAKKISINDIAINDSEGNRLSGAEVGSPIFIQSNLWIQIASESESYDQDYVYYAQVKQSGDKAFVEYIGTFDGNFDGPGSQNPIVEWTPEKSGLYFIETFVWDPKGIPLASKGPVILVLVN